MKIIFFGSSPYVIPVLEILKRNFDVSLVMTTEKNSSVVPQYCRSNNLPFLSIQQFNNEAIQQLQDSGTELAVLASFGAIIPQSVLDIFPKGILNIHPSYLPSYRGPTPVQTAILCGDTTTGVSIILLDTKVDHGPILWQEQVDIQSRDTAESLYKRLFQKGADAMVKIIPRYLSNALVPEIQNDSQATMTTVLKRNDGYVDLIQSVDPAKLERMIRAYHPWPGVWTRITLHGTEKILKLLPNAMIHVEGKKPIVYKDFLNGYPELPHSLRQLLNEIEKATRK